MTMEPEQREYAEKLVRQGNEIRSSCERIGDWAEWREWRTVHIHPLLNLLEIALEENSKLRAALEGRDG